MTTFFHNLYKYKQSNLRHQKENFITEIFAHCLRTDIEFQKRFLLSINCSDVFFSFDCQTQFTTDEFGKPDILIKVNNDTAIIIECKIDTAQEATQLSRYADILLSYQNKVRMLVFLTKHFEETIDFSTSISFIHKRWYHIFDLLSESTNEISKEFSNYLIEQKMSTKISFNKSEINAIKTFLETMAKMSDFLIRSKDMLSSYTNARIRLLKQIDNANYGIITDFQNGSLWLGFYQYENNNEIQLCISIEDMPLNNPNFDELDNELRLLNWECNDNNSKDKRTWWNSKDLSLFFRAKSLILIKHKIF